MSGSSESGSDGEEWGPQLRVAGFDPKEEVSANGGKPRAIQRIRASLPYSLVTMVRKSRFFFFSFFEKTKAES